MSVQAPSGHAIANGIITVALMEFLVQKRIITNADARGILETADRRIAPLASNNRESMLAAQIISDLLTRRFPI
jgi:hypothetical protein